MPHPLLRLSSLALLVAALAAPARAEVVVAEGEKFELRDDKGWKVTGQNDTYGSHTYGGMWMTHGGCLGAPADAVDSVAVQVVDVPKAGRYRVWSKYQAPPYFNYLHKIEIVQNGKTVFSSVYGKSGAPRLWSFSGQSDELWWFWGVDHDAAEAPKDPVELAAGPAWIHLTALANPKPAGDRFIDFVLLTTNLADDYDGFKPYAVGSPFVNEALAATKLFMRFRNTGKAAAQLTVSRAGHFQPQYGGATAKFPAAAVAPGQWSEWFNIGPFCRLVTDEGLTLTLTEAVDFDVQFSRDEAGKDPCGTLFMTSGEVALVPIDITWKKGAEVQTTKGWAEAYIHRLSRPDKWRTANGGKKPKEILFYGAFGGSEKWVWDLKDRLGYNTDLPEGMGYEQVARARVAAHYGSVDAIRQLAAGMKPEDKAKLYVVSFGDEIGLGRIDFADPKMQEKFRGWLKTKGVTPDDLKMPLDQAKLAEKGDPRLVWYSNLFNEEERFGEFREMTRVAKELFGPEVLTGANYSPHHLDLYYGPVHQWVDVFKHNGMSMFWAEDYIFSVPEAPQILSWELAEARCGVKYHNQPIHMYIMPHAPGIEPGYLRRNMALAVGSGARHIDNFWVAPEERFTENYVAWTYPETFRALHESIFDAAEAEKYQAGGKVRPARVAVVLSKATDFNESRLMIDKEKDPFVSRCKNADAKVNQILCRKDQQMLYLALRHAQHAVDLITEDDIAEGVLKDYDVVYFAGEWIDDRAVRKLDPWVQAGGVLYASAGCGRMNQYGEVDLAMRTLLGLKDERLTTNLVAPRTLLELPLAPPIDEITMDDGKTIPAIGMRQSLTVGEAKVLGKWKDGTAAVTVRDYGKGKAFAVGTLAGCTYMKTGLKPIPFARGGRHTVYNPVDFDAAATRLVRLGVDARKPEQAAVCGNPGVEAVVIDHKDGTLVTLVNWTNGPLKGLPVTVRRPAAPKEARSVVGQKTIPVKYADGAATFTVDLDEADYMLLSK